MKMKNEVNQRDWHIGLPSSSYSATAPEAGNSKSATEHWYVYRPMYMYKAPLENISLKMVF